jgi:hypothetical protein
LQIEEMIRRVKEAVQEKLRQQYESKRKGKPTEALTYLRFSQRAISTFNSHTRQYEDKTVYLLDQ